MLTLPAHADVAEGLRRLRDAGFRLGALSNSSQAAVEAQLAHAGVSSFFERILSVESVRRFKPSPEPYLFAAQQFGVEVGGLRMVAAHAWDVVRAMRAGCASAFIARPGAVWYPLAQRPDVIEPEIESLAERLIAMEIDAP